MDFIYCIHGKQGLEEASQVVTSLDPWYNSEMRAMRGHGGIRNFLYVKRERSKKVCPLSQKS